MTTPSPGRAETWPTQQRLPRSQTAGTQNSGLESRRSQSGGPEVYKTTLRNFASRKYGCSLFSGLHLQALYQFLTQSDQITSSQPNGQNQEDSFAVIHELYSSGSRRQIHKFASLDDAENALNNPKGNRLVFLKGFPDANWLLRVAETLKLDYEFIFQHLASNSQVNLSEMFSLPPLSLLNTGTIQLTFTIVGMWDNHRSGAGLETIRAQLKRSMKNYTDCLNRRSGMSPCDSIVRTFSVYDLKHFAIEQKVTIRFLQSHDYWTVVVWADCGSGLSRNHHCPWRQMEKDHATSVRFLRWPLDLTNRQIRHVVKCAQVAGDESDQHDDEPRDHFEQSRSFLCEELGRIEDITDAMASSIDPFHSLNVIFRLLAASEYQFLNLMEEKAEAFGLDVGDGISAIQMVKKQVDIHRERLQDVLEIVQNRGGRDWPSPDQRHSTSQRHSGDESEDVNVHHLSSAKRRADDAAIYLQRTFEKLIRRAQAVSDGCRDEMEKLSNESVVREARRGKEQAEALAKVTFIAAVFVPLSFATSIFGMNLKQLNESGPDIWVWIAVMVPVMLTSIAAWAVNGEMLKSVGRKISTNHSGEQSPAEERQPQGV